MKIYQAAVTSVAAAALVFTAACAADGGDSPPPGTAQANLPAPVRAASDAPSTPVDLTIDGAAAAIDAVATDTAGALLPPRDVHRLGWWVDSSLPGSGSGAIVVTGHVDDVQQGSGFASRFTTLRTGDTVDLTTTDGHRHDYRITRTVLADKEATGSGGLPVAELNRRDGPETLALITCGGPFIGPPLGYRDNVVVFAVPV
ncbi:class F sortase [Gordonia neofelifaecis]|uniref:Peptidase C60 sortase A and B n=1 Tax=Gordonia neofelifaecis NRRL B-59395 TaxID=644548 RepID=F1YGB9_9ACTN|nr:class F sortase [Gordonia neofelifaecis]EGD56138.1 peptidase C60 sortase A and B [Gordonia neofelifaecis NRRL B-59395]